MSYSEGEAKSLSGDDDYMSELKALASQIKWERLRNSVTKLLLRLKSQSGLGSLNEKLNILRLLMQDAHYIDDRRVKERFETTVRMYMVYFKQQLDNPVSETKHFIAVLKRVLSNGDANITDDMFYNEVSFYWIFGYWKAETTDELDLKLAVRKQIRYFVKDLTRSLIKMDLDAVLESLRFLILDFNAFVKRTTPPLPEDVKGAMMMMLQQARALESKLPWFIYKREKAIKEAEDSMRLPKHIRGRIKDFIGSKLRF